MGAPILDVAIEVRLVEIHQASPRVDAYFVLLATWFFWLRVAHTVTHIFYNKVIPGIAIPVRTIFWLPSTIILGWMAYRACSVMM